MKKRIVAILMCAVLTCSVFGGCGSKASDKEEKHKTESIHREEKEEEKSLAENDKEDREVKSLQRPSLINEPDDDIYDPSLKPSVPEYSVEGDFENVINGDMMTNRDNPYINASFGDTLKKNLFVVGDEDGREFYETYEFNAYSQTPNFVTVDSMMHTYHIYFAHLLKNTEATYLSDTIKDMTAALLDKSAEQYEEYKGTEWEDAAKANVEYFAVAATLIGLNPDVPDYASDVTAREIDKIMAASGIEQSDIFADMMEDYSQYIPRGYYAGDSVLENYFRTMMWFGRITFPASDEAATRSAVLASLAIKDVSLREWESVYAVTSFFAGASDDLGYCEYLPLIESIYGTDPGESELVGSALRWKMLNLKISKLSPPQIQSIPVYEDEENVIPGFRVMGQRFTIDGNIMQNLIYRAVAESSDGARRMMPDVLDVPAALGSEMAEEIMLEAGASQFPDYKKNLDALRSDINNAPSEMWNASLYAGWINTLRPLLDEKKEGYPSFMQSDEWTKKTLETFAGSYTELKHDTVLYAKQPMAEMGGGDMDPVDDRGYVEPEPLVYSRFRKLAKATANGLDSYGMLSKEDKDNLGLLEELAEKLLVISQKELRNELLEDEEYELIRNYGGNIEHFWYEAMKDQSEEQYFTSEEFPAALVTDVATDPNGVVLEAGCGNPREIYVVVPVDGILRIATGSAYNFYEFEWPLSDRLTDEKWRQMCGADPGEGYVYERDKSLDNPSWTKSYRDERWNFPTDW